jgi:hypothetical protein
VASGVSKTALTNASFRTRKLPDDIPIVAAPVGANATPTTTASTTLTSINEETEDGDGKETKNSKSKGHSNTTPTGKVLQGLKGLGKDRKDKKKDKESGGKKDKKADKLESVNQEAGARLVNKNCVIEEVGDGSSDLSETRSFGSDHESIPLTAFKPSLTGRVMSGALDVDDGTSNCSSSNLGSTDAVNLSLPEGQAPKAVPESTVNV